MFDPEGSSSYGTVLFCFCSVSSFLSPAGPQKTFQAQAGPCCSSGCSGSPGAHVSLHVPSQQGWSSISAVPAWE